MRRLFVRAVLFIGLALSSASYGTYQPSYGRGNALLRFIANHPGLRQYTFYSLMSARCNRYLPLFEASFCNEAVARQVALLDFDIMFNEVKTSRSTFGDKSWTPDSFVFIAFKSELIRLLNDPATSEYLLDLNQKLSRFMTHENPDFNIWNYTLDIMKSRPLAARFIATLFQDTSDMKLHLAYLEKKQIKGNEYFKKNQELLSRVIDTINLILDYSENNYAQLFYPKEATEVVTRNIYHFYVPFYISMALEKEGYPKRYAQAAPMIMTITYEFITLASDFRYLLQDPKSLNAKEQNEKIQDIYGGYVGPMLGIEKNKDIIPYSVIKYNFSESTFKAMYSLLFGY